MTVNGVFNYLGMTEGLTQSGQPYCNVSLVQQEDQSIQKFYPSTEVANKCKAIKPFEKVNAVMSVSKTFRDGVERTYIDLKDIVVIK